MNFEYSIVDKLHAIGLRTFENVHFFYPAPEEQPNIDTTNELISTLCLNYDKLTNLGIEIRQNIHQIKYFFGQIETKTKVLENQDWFDVHIEVVFGDFKIPFVKLRQNILFKIKEFELPDGSIAIIPKSGSPNMMI